MGGRIEPRDGSGRHPGVEAAADDQQRSGGEGGHVAGRLEGSEGGGAQGGGEAPQQGRPQGKDAGEDVAQRAAAVEEGRRVDAGVARGRGRERDAEAHAHDDGAGRVHPGFGLQPGQHAPQLAGQGEGGATQGGQLAEPRPEVPGGRQRRGVLHGQDHGVERPRQEGGRLGAGLPPGDEEDGRHPAGGGAVRAAQVAEEGRAIGGAELPAQQGLGAVRAQADNPDPREGNGIERRCAAAQGADDQDSPQAAPPRALLIQPAQWPRALLRAELEEQGVDAVGAPSLVAALDVDPLEPGRGPVRAVLIDQDALADPLWRTWVHALRVRHPTAKVLLVAPRVAAPAPGPWDEVLRRPVSIGELATAVRRAAGL